MEFNFSEQLEQDTKAYNIQRSEYFKFKEGDNNFRVLSPFAVLARHQLGPKQSVVCYGQDEGCPFHGENEKELRVKWWLWIHDLSDDKIKIAEMPYTVIQALGQLQKSEDYSFDTLPMPYTVNVKAENAGQKDVKYTILPARKNSETPEHILNEFASQKSIEDIVEAVKQKAKEKVY